MTENILSLLQKDITDLKPVYFADNTSYHVIPYGTGNLIYKNNLLLSDTPDMTMVFIGGVFDGIIYALDTNDITSPNVKNLHDEGQALGAEFVKEFADRLVEKGLSNPSTGIRASALRYAKTHKFFNKPLPKLPIYQIRAKLLVQYLSGQISKEELKTNFFESVHQTAFSRQIEHVLLIQKEIEKLQDNLLTEEQEKLVKLLDSVNVSSLMAEYPQISQNSSSTCAEIDVESIRRSAIMDEVFPIRLYQNGRVLYQQEPEQTNFVRR